MYAARSHWLFLWPIPGEERLGESPISNVTCLTILAAKGIILLRGSHKEYGRKSQLQLGFNRKQRSEIGRSNAFNTCYVRLVRPGVGQQICGREVSPHLNSRE